MDHSELERTLNEGNQSAEGSDSVSESHISEQDLPSLSEYYNDPYPERLEKLLEEYSRAVHRNQWPVPEAFVNSPLPVPFEPNDQRI